VFMVIFNVLIGRGSGEASRFYTPAIIVFAVITATYTNLAMSVAMARDEGILKRMRGTPLPAWAYLAGRIIHAVVIGVLLVVIVAAFGALFYNVAVPWAHLPELALTLVLGAASFCALGLALTAFIPNADAAPAVVNATILPLLFISNVFIRLDGAPAWIDTLSSVFPVRHFANAMLAIYAGTPLAWSDLAVITAWGAAGVLIALRFFSWEPRR
jgi:ABC-2 type transport system permease protein